MGELKGGRSTHWRIERNSEDFLGESTKERERSKLNRVHPGMLLITLGILTHFFFVCSFLNTLILLIGVDGKGHKLLC